MNLKRSAGLLISFLLITVLITVCPVIADEGPDAAEPLPEAVESLPPAEIAETISQGNASEDNSDAETGSEQQRGTSGEAADGAGAGPDLQEGEAAGQESGTAVNTAGQENGTAEKGAGQDPAASGNDAEEHDGLGTVPSVPYGEIVQMSADTATGTASFAIEVHSSSEIKSVVVPTWSYTDQRDIIWYEAKAGDDGLYHCSFNIASHNYHWAKYNSHVYAKGTDGSMTYIDGISTYFELPGDTPEVSISNMEFTLTMPEGEGPFPHCEDRVHLPGLQADSGYDRAGQYRHPPPGGN